MKIGILGGCFNPPHKIHLKIALELIKQEKVDKVIFVPTGSKYTKSGLASEKERYEMLKIMCQNHPKLEISKFEFGGLKYTYQTLSYFQNKYKKDEIYFITGTDNLKEFETWKQYPFILENFKIIIIKRNEDSIEDLKQTFESYTNNLIFITLGKETISSTQIRNNIKERGISEELTNYFSKEILAYIKTHKLYLE